MLEHELTFRVLYSDTDKMGYMYYGRDAKYLEMGRVELLRTLGLSYKLMEDNGLIMPVLDLKLKYIKPLYYDEEIILKTKVTKRPSSRIHFEYELINPEGMLTTKAETTLVFVDRDTRKPCLIPDDFNQKVTLYFDEHLGEN